ncbi:TRAP transporter substrate-binding protein DctP [Candidatus Uhrbacteria bacterium]|nr:TRAP transporter substrate-binding protein DctP [Candidatus Uhrbacteria bacterium]
MNMSRISTYILVTIVLGLAVFFWARMVPTTAPAEKPTEIRWLIAHQPADLFVRGTKIFADVLAKETNGSMTLTVLIPEDAGFPGGDVPSDKLFTFLDDGTIQLATVYAGSVEKKNAPYGIINLPFLFDSYESAEKVFDGPLGTQIRDTVEKKTSLRALAITYSGGYRLIASDKRSIKGAGDFKGLRIGTAGGPVGEALFRELGAIPVPIPTVASGKNYLTAGDVDAVETAYTRLSFRLASSTYVRYISETNHSLFTTATIVTKAFYNSLTPVQQRALERAAQLAAKVEREDSIALAKKTKRDAQEQGIRIIELSPSASADLKSRLLPVYKKFEATFGADLIQNIVDEQR